MVDFYLEDFEIHCYHKGNLGNPTPKQVPDPGTTIRREGKGLACTDSRAEDSRAHSQP